MIRLGTKDGNFQDLKSLIEALNPPDTAFWWVRCRTQALLSCGAFSEKAPIEKSYEGRIFWEAGELRWKLISAGLRMVWCGEEVFPDMEKGMNVFSFELHKTKDLVCPLDHSHVMDFSTLPKLRPGDLLCLKIREYRTKQQGDFLRFLAVLPKSSSWRGFLKEHGVKEVEDA